MRSQFTFYRSFYEAVRELPAKTQTEVIMAICAYALDGQAPKLSGTAKAVFTLIKPTLDVAERKSAGRRREDNGKTPVRPDEDTGKEKEKEVEKEKEKEIEIEVEGEIEKEKENDSSISLLEKESIKKKIFRPPTVEEVEAYCQERNNGIDPQRFCDFYASKGWRIGKDSPMKDWRAAVRTWESRREEERARPQGKKNGITFEEKMQVFRDLRDEYREAGI